MSETLIQKLEALDKATSDLRMLMPVFADRDGKVRLTLPLEVLNPFMQTSAAFCQTLADLRKTEATPSEMLGDKPVEIPREGSQRYCPCGCNKCLYASEPKRESCWVPTKERLPEKPGKQGYEHVDCLIVLNGEVLSRPWNCEHLVWDREDYDDFFCEATKPSHWMLKPNPPEIEGGS